MERRAADGADGSARQHELPGDPRPESRAARDDRNLIELLNELRVTGLGVQVLFGFLLSLPFTGRFVRLGEGQRALYVITLVLTAVSIVLLVGPVAYHRLVFRLNQKESLIGYSNALSLCGLVSVCLAVTSAVLLVTSYVVGWAGAIIISALILGMFAVLWFTIPGARRHAAQTGRMTGSGLGES